MGEIKEVLDRIEPLLYSVMQSDGNRFCGDILLDSFTKASKDEGNILGQIYLGKYVRILIMMILTKELY